MNVPLVLLNRRRQGGAFSPTRLFAANETGVWLDPSDLTTLFQDPAGTTPVTTAAQTVALALDKSRGLVLGSETVSNPGNPYSSTTGFVGVNLDAGYPLVSDGRVVSLKSAGTTTVSGVHFDTSVQANRLQRVVVDVEAVGQSFTVGLYNGASFSNLLASAAVGAGSRQTVTLYALPTLATLRIYIFNNSSSTRSVALASASIREIRGIHATQSSSSFRPAYQTTPQRFNFDGSDDRLAFTYNPTTSGSLAVRINGSTASRVAIGSQGATDGRCFIGLASDGSLAAGIGTQTTATIKGSTDIRGTWTTGVVTWDGTTVRLYENGTEVYSGAQSGAVNTTVPFDLGCLNNNGTRAAFWGGGIGAAIALGRVMTPAEITSLHQFWSNIA